MNGDLERFAAANARVRALLPSLLGWHGLQSLAEAPPAAPLPEAVHRETDGAAVLSGDRLAGSRLAAVGLAVLGLLADPERAFVREFLRSHEVENLKLLLRAVHRGIAPATVAPLLVPLAGIEAVDPARLGPARDLRDFVERLSGSPYETAARAGLRRMPATGLFGLELALELDYRERLWQAAGTLRPSDTARARQLLGVLFDVLDLSWIERYRSMPGGADDEIVNRTPARGRWLTDAARRALAAGHGAGSAPGGGKPGGLPFEALAGTPYAAMVRPDGGGLDNASLWRFLAAEARRTLRGYPFHIGVPLGFLLTQEIERRDLRTLTAARRLGVPAAEVVANLASVPDRTIRAGTPAGSPR